MCVNNLGIGLPYPTGGYSSAFHASPYGPLRPNVTSSIKPEVHNVSQRRQRRTEPRPQGICSKKSWRSDRSNAVPEMLADRPTHRQTNWSQYTAPQPGRSNNRLVFYTRPYMWRNYHSLSSRRVFNAGGLWKIVDFRQYRPYLDTDSLILQDTYRVTLLIYQTVSMAMTFDGNFCCWKWSIS